LSPQIARNDDERQAAGCQGQGRGAGADAGEIGVEDGGVEVTAFDRQERRLKPSYHARYGKPDFQQGFLQKEGKHGFVFNNENRIRCGFVWLWMWRNIHLNQ
jgi:hypothetical protein